MIANFVKMVKRSRMTVVCDRCGKEFSMKVWPLRNMKEHMARIPMPLLHGIADHPELTEHYGSYIGDAVLCDKCIDSLGKRY